MGADREIVIKFRTEGDPSGAAAVTGAIDATAESSRRATDSIVQDQRRQKEALDAAAAAARNAAAVRDTGGSAGGRSWSIPGTNYNPPPQAAAPVPVSVPAPPPGTPAFEAAPPAITDSSGTNGGGLPDLAKGANDAGKAANALSAELDKAAAASGKMSGGPPLALAEGLEKAGDTAEGVWTKLTGLDSVSDEMQEIGERLKEVLGAEDDGKQAEALEATAAAAKKAAKAEEDAAAGRDENNNSATEGLKEKTEATLNAAESAKKAAAADNEAAEAAGEAAEGTADFGSKAMRMAAFADDMQYGLKGIMNQIPQFVADLGLGTGAAGVIGVLMVVVNQLIGRLDIFGESAEEAAEKVLPALRQISAEAGRTYAQAADAAEEWNTSFDNARAHEDAIDDAAKKYNELADSIKRAADERRQLNILAISEGNAELALMLSEIELRRRDGKLTDIDAARQSHRARRDFAQAQFNLTQGQAGQEIDDGEKNLAGMRTEMDLKERERNRIAQLSHNLVRSADWAALEKRLADARATADKAVADLDATPEKSVIKSLAAPDIEIDNPDHPAAVAMAENAQRTLRQVTDQYRAVKAARGGVGKDLEDLESTEKYLKDEGEWLDKRRIQIREAGQANEVKRKTLESTARQFRLSQRTGDVEAAIQIRDLEDQQGQEAEREADSELAEKRRKEKEASDKHFDELDKQFKARQQQARPAGGRRGGRRNSSLDDGGSTVADQRREADDAMTERWRREDQQRKLDREEDKRLRLLPPDEQGVDKDPADWQGPRRPGFPSGPARAAAPDGTDRQRRDRMRGLDSMASSPPGRPVVRRSLPPPPAPARGVDDDGRDLASSLGGFVGGKRRAGDRLGGGDPRLNELAAAAAALKDGTTTAELQQLTATIISLLGTVLAGNQADRDVLKAATVKITSMERQLNAGRR